MAIKDYRTLVTTPGTNEQTGVHEVTVTATGTSREYPELGQLTTGIIFLNITAVSGSATPTLTVAFQCEDPVTNKWHDVATFPAQTAVTSGNITPLVVDLLALNFRLSWTVSGTTPSFTFSCCIIASTEEAAP